MLWFFFFFFFVLSFLLLFLSKKDLRRTTRKKKKKKEARKKKWSFEMGLNRRGILELSRKIVKMKLINGYQHVIALNTKERVQENKRR